MTKKKASTKVKPRLVMKTNILYRKKFKYQLEEDYVVKTRVYPEEDVELEHAILHKTGLLVIRKGFAWDGSTWALDRVKSRRGSLIHDVLYRMMNLGLLAWSWKPAADFEYYKALIEDGFWKRWANVRFRAVRMFGGGSGKTAHTLCSAPDKNAVNKDTSGLA